MAAVNRPAEHDVDVAVVGSALQSSLREREQRAVRRDQDSGYPVGRPAVGAGGEDLDHGRSAPTAAASVSNSEASNCSSVPARRPRSRRTGVSASSLQVASRSWSRQR